MGTDKFHFMVTFAVHILLNSKMSVLAFWFVFCKPMLLRGFIHKGRGLNNLKHDSLLTTQVIGYELLNPSQSL